VISQLNGEKTQQRKKKENKFANIISFCVVLQLILLKLCKIYNTEKDLKYFYFETHSIVWLFLKKGFFILTMLVHLWSVIANSGKDFFAL
jgi:hypothetical protein